MRPLGLREAGRLRQDGLVAGPAAASDRATAAVKQAQRHTMGAEQFDQGHFCLVQGPGRGEESAVLVAVGIAQHDFLGVFQPAQHRTRQRQGQPARHDQVGARKVDDRFEQRNHVHAGHPRLRQVKPASFCSIRTSSMSDTDSQREMM